MTADDIAQIIVAGQRTGIVGLKKTLEEVAGAVCRKTGCGNNGRADGAAVKEELHRAQGQGCL